MSQIVQPKARLDALDGWRAIAVSLVILDHLTKYSALRILDPRINLLGEFGKFGVYMFFAISGYVICSVLKHEYVSSGRVSLAAFYIRRCFRILPPLWCYASAIALLTALGVIQAGRGDPVRAAAFVCNFAHGNCGWYVYHTWSLAYEEQFYIVFPLLFFLLTPKRRGAFLVLALALPVFISLCYVFKHRFPGDYASYVEFMIVGVVMALFSDEIKRHAERIHPAIVYTCAALIFVLYCLPPMHGVVTTLRIFVGCPLVGLVLFYTSHFDCAAKRALSRPLIRFVGRISYSVYLWQQLGVGYYQGAGVVFYGFTLCLLAIVCVVSFRYLETPLIRLGSRLSEARIQRELAGRLVPAEAQA